MHIDFDADPLLIEALSKGKVHSFLVQQAYMIGYQAVRLALQSLRGELSAQPVNIALPVQQVNRENLAQWLQARKVELTVNP